MLQGKKKKRKYDHNLGGKQSFPIQDMNGTNQKEKNNGKLDDKLKHLLIKRHHQKCGKKINLGEDILVTFQYIIYIHT